MTSPHIKAVIFDIGGVVLRSPLLAIAAYERELGLPHNYINCSITGRGAHGAWAHYERGEMSLIPFYKAFGHELSDHANGNIWYAEYCRRRNLECPRLPSQLIIDGRELFGRMMREGGVYDDLVVEAIHRIRATKKFRVIALTNNFSKSSDLVLGPSDFPLPAHLHKWYDGVDISSPEAIVAAELEYLGWEGGATPAHLRALFDDFCDSSSLGMRKPDPMFYQLACDRNGVQPRECVFLDDLGMNLKPAKEMGMETIHVPIGGSRDAIRQLQEKLGIDLINGTDVLSQPNSRL